MNISNIIFRKCVGVLSLLICFAISQSQAQDTGVLIMAHGGSDEWNQHVKDAADPLEEDYPV